MEDFQLLIYIAFALIYFLTRGLRKKKKQPVRSRKPQQEKTDSHPINTDTKETPPITFGDLLKEFTGKGQKPEKPQRPLVKPKPPKREYDFESDYPTDEEIDEVYRESVQRAELIKEEPIKSEPVKIRSKPVIPEKEKLRFVAYQIEDDENPFATEIIEMMRNPEDFKKAIILKELIERRHF